MFPGNGLYTHNDTLNLHCFLLLKGNDLSTQYEDEAEEWLFQQYPEFVSGLMLLKLKDANAFPSRMFTDQLLKTISPSKWWSIIDKRNEKATNKKLPQGFCKFISKLQTCPASSGSIERIFSSFGLVWSKVRNRLGSDKAQKLVKIYRQYRN